MELRHLRYFLAVAETLHFSRAAARLHLTQPALSRQIRDLEAELGVSLLRRHGTQTSLTSAGERFALRVREILVATERAVEEARTAARVVRFGHYGALWVDHFAPALRAFAKQFPEVVLQPVELTPAELVGALRTGAVDIALLGPVTETVRQEFATSRVGAVAAVLALGAANPLAKRRVLRLETLRDASWVMWDEHAFPGRAELLREAAAAVGFVPRVAQTVDSVTSLFIHVATSDAVGYVLPMSKQLPHSGVVFAALKPPVMQFEMNVGWRRGAGEDARLGRLAELLVDRGMGG